ncbi:MAG: hypothetical protein ABFS16_13715 [Bacteroidota bacterium]
MQQRGWQPDAPGKPCNSARGNLTRQAGSCNSGRGNLLCRAAPCTCETANPAGRVTSCNPEYINQTQKNVRFSLMFR